MHVTIPQSTLARELGFVCVAANRKASIPILSTVRIEAGADGIALTATDLEHALSARVPCAVKDAGAICIPAARLLALVRALSGDVTIKTDDRNYATVTASRSKSRIAGLAVAEYPEVPSAPDTAFAMDARSLSRVFARVSFAISMEESRFTVNGALLKVADSLVAVTTDGHRLAYVEERGVSAMPPFSSMIPKAAIGHYGKLTDMSEGGATVAVSQDENHLFFAVGLRLVVARKLTGNFPDYSRIMPKHASFIGVDREALKGAIDRVAQFADERSKSARFTFAADELTIAAKSAETGESEESVPCLAGFALEAGFNTQYFSEVLAVCAHSRVAIYVKDSTSAAEIRPMQGAGTAEDPYVPATGARYVIMPMRL